MRDRHTYRKPSWKYLHTIRFRILLITISFLVLVSAAVIYVSYAVLSDRLVKNLIQTSETKLALLCSSIDSNMDGVMSFADSCKKSSKIRNFLMETNPNSNTAMREAREFISETYNANAILLSNMVRLVIIGNPNDNILQMVESTYSAPITSAENIYSLPYFRAIRSNQGTLAAGIQNDPFLQNREVPMLPFLLAVEHPYRNDDIGYIFTEISLNVITKPMQDYFTEETSTLIFQVGNGQYAYKDGSLLPYDSPYRQIMDFSGMALDQDTSIQRAIDDATGKVAIILTRPLETKGLYVKVCCDMQALQGEINRAFSLITLVIILSATAIGIILSWFLNRTINVPVKMLQKRMERIANGDFSRDSSTEWDHELGEIGKNINDMSENILTLMNQKIDDERQKRDYEYKMLQSQINPHFLYNTLNSIKWMATAQNASGIAEMTTALSRLLRNISNGTTTLIPLEEELSLIKDYFTIQQYRYGGTVTLRIDTEDEGLLRCQIIKFTLQPIVENAIFHGIEPKGSIGTISIHTYRIESGDVRIDVTDDGIGMTPDVVSRLLQNDSPAGSSFFKEIGISNVHKRMQYEFGEAYGLSVHSEPGKYTTVSILLPYQTV